MRGLMGRLVRAGDVLGDHPEPLVGIDEHGLITRWNPAAAALFGWEPREIVGRPVADVLVDGPRPFRASGRATDGPPHLPAVPRELTAVHRDGSRIPVEMVVGAARGSRRVRHHLFLRDLRSRRAAEEDVRRLATLVDATGDAIMSMDLEGRVTSWNAGARALFGWSAEDVLGRRADELLVPAERIPELRAVLRQTRLGRRIPPYETWRLHKDGTEVEVSLTVSPLIDAQGSVTGACASARDMTDSRRQLAELREASQLFRLAFDAVPSGMVLTSVRPEDPGRIIRVNAGFCWIIGYTQEELRKLTMADLTHPDDIEDELALLESFASGRQRSVRLEKRYVRGDGSTVWAMVSSALVEGANGAPHYAVTQVEDLTARRAELDRLTALALGDPLTGLANRLSFDDRLTQAVHRAKRHPRTIAVIYCDLDDFKPINDQFGHAVGDELLRQVGHRLIVALRPSDTVARLGGDEFAVICEDLPDADAVDLLKDRVRAAIEGTYIVSAGAVRIGCSLGSATASGPDIDGRELVSRADLAMFDDKRARHEAGLARGR